MTCIGHGAGRASRARLPGAVVALALSALSGVFVRAEEDAAALRARFAAPEPPRTLNPLVWYHGEPEPLIREELEKCREGGCGAVTVESRPHADYLGPKWWSDLALTIDACRRLGLEAWIFDERWYPSGIAGGLVQKTGEDHWRCYIRMVRQRVEGPRPGFTWTFRGGRTVEGVVAGRWNGTSLDGASLVDLTPSTDLARRTVAWDVPEGAWELMAFVVARDNGYIDALDPRVTDRFIELTYQPAFERFGAEFGKVVQGFFQDEPGFWNIGEGELPWTPGFREAFKQERGYDLLKLLPSLWLDVGPDTHHVRFDYYDYVIRRYVRAYTGRIHAWCRAHGVRLIGHIYEHWNGRTGDHWSLGTGSGHFFWVNEELDVPSIDLVCNQVVPEGPHRPDYWGLAKLGSSAAHVYGKRDDLNLNETFGGYGWHEGLRMMKWLTDWQCVRGVNWFVPHAMDPKWPDEDYPPHFWARGNNPQWPYFKRWAGYANRMCDLLQGGRHVAPVALLYPAESFWSAGCPPIEQIEAGLLQSQWDFDLVPFDLFADPKRCVVAPGAGAGTRPDLRIAKEAYAAVLLPPADVVPAAVADRLRAWIDAGGAAVAVAPVPTRACEWGKDERVRAAVAAMFPAGVTPPAAGRARACALTELPAALSAVAGDAADATAEPPAPWLRVLHRVKAGADVFLFTNEDAKAAVRTAVRVRAAGAPELWDPWSGAAAPLSVFRRLDDGRAEIPLELEPYESRLIVFVPGPEPAHVTSAPPGEVTGLAPAAGGGWTVTVATAATGPHRAVVRDGNREASASADVPGPAPAPVPLGPWTLRFVDPVPLARFQVEVTGADGSRHEAEQGVPGPWLPRDRAWRARWIWTEALEGGRRFRRAFDVEGEVDEAVLAVAADNMLDVFVNGRKAARAEGWQRPARADVTALLRAGRNALAVDAVNSGGPGGVLAELVIWRKGMKDPQVIATGPDWKVTDAAVAPGWDATDFDDASWGAPKDIGAPPAGPWGDIGKPDLGSALALPAAVRFRAETPWDFESVLFPEVQGACEAQAGAEAIPDASGREVRLAGRARTLEVTVRAVSRRDGLRGGIRARAAVLTLPELRSWPELGFPHYSGAAVYRTTATVPTAGGCRWTLDLGDVQEIAEVEVNGAPAGMRLCPPYRFDVTSLLRSGENAVAVRVVNTLANRCAAPDWTWGWGKVLPSGLRGPVTLTPRRIVTMEAR